MNSLKKTWGRACQKSLNPERVEYRTLKGLNMNSLKKTWGRACQKSLNPERVEYET